MAVPDVGVGAEDQREALRVGLHLRGCGDGVALDCAGLGGEVGRAALDNAIVQRLRPELLEVLAGAALLAALARNPVSPDTADDLVAVGGRPARRSRPRGRLSTRCGAADR